MPVSRRELSYEVTSLQPPWQAGRRPVVFHHGIGATRDIWSAWVAPLATRHPVIRFDMRGFGRTAAKLPHEIDDMLEILIDDLFDVVEDDGPVHLVGESAGGTVVLAAALQHPERVASVTISNAAFIGSGIGQIGGWRRLFDEHGVEGWSEHMMESRFAHSAVDAQALAWFARQQLQTSASSALAVSAMLAKIDLSTTVHALKPPLLILAPGESPFVPLTMNQRLHQLTPGSELQVFPGVRHGLAFSHAPQCARMLADFLRRRAEI